MKSVSYTHLDVYKGQDMDWHLVDIDPKYGSGWTGYTWNRELFPNPTRFLDNLHTSCLLYTSRCV